MSSILVKSWGKPVTPSHATFRATSASEYAAGPGCMDV